MRRDAWWVQPALVVFLLTSFIVYATWARSRQVLHLRPYLSLSTLRSCSVTPPRLVRAQADLVAGLAGVLHAC